MKINLGCGNRHLEGFVNVDMADNWCSKPPDVSCNIAERLPFDDGVADEIHAYHVFEHFYRYEADQILMDWIRVLKPGGTLVLELPCLDKIIDIFRFVIEGGHELPEHLTLWGLYGDPKYANPAMVHRWCYSASELTDMLAIHGLEVTQTKAQTHQPLRDMRLEGVKRASTHP
jgi:predicted SAM-dependent methyltransferase